MIGYREQDNEQYKNILSDPLTVSSSNLPGSANLLHQITPTRKSIGNMLAIKNYQQYYKKELASRQA